MKSRIVYSERKLKRTLIRNKNKAEAFLKDDEKIESLLQNFEKKMKLVPHVGGELANVSVMISMVRAYVKGEYKMPKRDIILLAVAGIIYVVNPVDLVPDTIPVIGLLDDVKILRMVLKWIRKDLNDYKHWRNNK